MYTAVLRRVAGGGLKTAKRGGGDLFLPDTRTANVSTFFTCWPRHLTTFLCYGRSAHAEARYPADLGARALMRVPRRAYGNLALRDEDPKELARLAGGSAELLTFPQSQAVEPAPAKRPATKMTLHKLKLKHAKKQPISVLTAYDYPSARLADAAGVDVLLVGDSLGMVVLGREDTTDVTMDEMVHHCKASARGSERALLLGDLPFGSCITPYDAARNGVRLVKEGRVDAVKLEGGERMVPQVRALVDAGVAVCGHIGLTPQSYAQLGGYRVQGRTADAACRLIAEARALEAAGCFAIVLEMVPTPVAAEVTAQLSIPTIGIGAGIGTSGQVQVFHDVLGLYDKKAPKFSQRFGAFEEPMVEALAAYTRSVDAKAFPQPVHSFPMDAAEEAKFRIAVDDEVAATQTQLDDKHNGGGAPYRASATSAASAASAAAQDGAIKMAAGVASRHALTPSAAEGFSSAAMHISASAKPHVVRTVAEWRRLQASGTLPSRSLGLVPTMGALHDGHLSLVRRAQRENEATAVSIFVNPKQFAPTDDLSVYPRPWEADLAALTKMSVDYVFAPPPDEMYPPHRPKRLAPFVDLADVDGATAEGASRPGFFRGVATVVAKLLNIIGPRSVYFGQKDGMQCVVVRRLIEDLDFDVKLIVNPTVREADGLAMSSRNVYLSTEERQAAPAVYAALIALGGKYDQGERSVEALRAAAARVVAAEPSMTLDYLSLASAIDGREMSGDERLRGAEEPTLASIAVKLGTTRLIDNVVLE